MKKILFFALFLGAANLMGQNTQQATQNGPKDAQPGKCYEKCKMPDGGQEWQEVVCQTRNVQRMLTDLAMALENAGYNVGEVKDRMTQEFTNTLKRYQADNNLPIGGLNIKTFEALGVSH